MTIRPRGWVPAAAGAFAVLTAVTAFAPSAAAEPQVNEDEKPAASSEDPTKTASSPSEDTSAESSASKPAKPDAKAAAEWRSTDVAEDPQQKYYFIGLRYRGNIVPAFIQHIFVDEGGTVYSNSIGLEADIRKDGFSLVPALSYTEYGTGDILFKEKNKPDLPQNYSYVNSSLKAIYATVDVLWSTPLAKNVDFEYGLGVGIGFVFGDLINNWVYQNDASGPYSASNGHHYAPCQSELQDPACQRVNHSNADTAKVGGYVEKNWFNGGSVPTIFPWLSLPQLGLRFKALKQLEGRLGVGFSLTGFWFGLSADYGLEHKPDAATTQKSGSILRWGGGN